MRKLNVGITVDAEYWLRASKIYPRQLSGKVNDFLRYLVEEENGENLKEKTKLEDILQKKKEIEEEKKKELIEIRSELEKLSSVLEQIKEQEEKQMNKEKEELKDKQEEFNDFINEEGTKRIEYYYLKAKQEGFTGTLMDYFFKYYKPKYITGEQQ